MITIVPGLTRLSDTLAAAGTLSDGRLELEWAGLAEPIAAILAFFRKCGVTLDAPVGLQCANSTPGALTLLALISRETTTALLPSLIRPELALPAPRFLRHIIRVANPNASSGDVSLLRPETYLQISENDDFVPLPADAALCHGRLLLRTSGSISSPKLVVHRQAEVLSNARNAIERLGLHAADRVLIPTPLAHMYGLGAAFFPALLVGASIRLIEGTNMLSYLHHERSFRPTVAFLTPNLCNMLLRPRSSTDSYRGIVVAGDRLNQESFAPAEALYKRVLTLYGSTELGVICAQDAHQAASVNAAVTVGRPLPAIKLRLELRPDETNLEDGRGELLCSHPHGFEGYVDNDGAPLPIESASPPGWYDTRDLARIHQDGSLEVLGRSDHALKRDGKLVRLGEIERALERLPDVEKAVIVIGGETPRGRAMLAFLVPRPGALLAAESLHRACQESLPIFAVPDEFCVLPELPLLPSGKVDRHRLAKSMAKTRDT